MVLRRLALQVQAARQHPLMHQAVLHALLHFLPHLVQIFQIARLLMQIHIFPQRPPVLATPMQDITHRMQLVDFLVRIRTALFQENLVRPLLANVSAPHAEHRPIPNRLVLGIIGLKNHPIRMLRKKNPRVFENRQLVLAHHMHQGLVGKVSLARGGQASVKAHRIAVGIRVSFLEDRSGSHGAHRMAAGRAVPYLVDLANTFHRMSFCDHVFICVHARDAPIRQMRCRKGRNKSGRCQKRSSSTDIPAPVRGRECNPMPKEDYLNPS